MGELDAPIAGAIVTVLITSAVVGLQRLVLLASPRERARRVLARDLPLLEHAPEGEAKRRWAALLEERMRTYVDALEHPSRAMYLALAAVAVLFSAMSVTSVFLVVVLAFAVTQEGAGLELPAQLVTLGAAVMATGWAVFATVTTWRDVGYQRRALAAAQTARLARRLGLDTPQEQ